MLHVEECIRLLVKHGANINARDAEGKTSLHYPDDLIASKINYNSHL